MSVPNGVGAKLSQRAIAARGARPTRKRSYGPLTHDGSADRRSQERAAIRCTAIRKERQCAARAGNRSSGDAESGRDAVVLVDCIDCRSRQGTRGLHALERRARGSVEGLAADAKAPVAKERRKSSSRRQSQRLEVVPIIRIRRTAGSAGNSAGGRHLESRKLPPLTGRQQKRFVAPRALGQPSFVGARQGCQR